MREQKRIKIKLIDFLMGIFFRKLLKNEEKVASLSRQEFRSIMIWSTTALGDYMFNSAALRAIRQRYPRAKIVLVAHPKYQQLLSRRDYYDEVIFWNNKLGTLPALWWQGRKFAPELGVILHAHIPYDILSAGLLGCRYLIRDNYNRDIGPLKRWLCKGLDQSQSHLVQRKLEVAEMLGADVSNVAMALPCDFPKVSLPVGVKRIGFQLGASTKIRCWPPTYFAQLAQRLLAEQPELEIVMIGAENERSLAEQVLANVEPTLHPRMVNMVGNTTLPELLGNIDSMTLLVTGDTGPLHLAIALQVSTLSLFVSEEPRFSGPYQDQEIHRVIYLPLDHPRVTDKEEPLTAISVDEVYSGVKELYHQALSANAQ